MRIDPRPNRRSILLDQQFAVRTKPLARRTLRVRFHQQDRVVESKVGTPTKEVSQ